jgi:hypothetical protein
MHRRHAFTILALGSLLFSPTVVLAGNASFDHSYAQWDSLLKAHVKWLPDGKQTRVDYRGFANQRPVLQQILEQWSAVTPAAFAAFTQEQRMAFLINAYNGFTVELILTKYPNVKSIKDIGSFLVSPWKGKFFTLLGEARNLDWIENDQLRSKFNDPRVHTAINCASIGCPALRPEAFTAAAISAQLADGMARFMGDHTRNRFNAQSGKLEVSSIFKWFREDFEKGNKGFSRLEDVFAVYADQLTDGTAARGKLTAKTVDVVFLDYDWSLNDTGR